MNDYHNSVNSAGSISVIKKFGNFTIRQSNQGGVPPVLPDVFVEYSFTDAQKSIGVQGTNISFKFPKVNEMLTEYCRKCLPAICTLAFIDLVNEEIPQSSTTDLIANQKSSSVIFPVSNERLESAVSLYNRVYNQPKISAEAEQTLSYYFGSSTNWLGLLNLKSPESKISELKNYLKNLETIYTKRLIDEVLAATSTDHKGNPIPASVLKYFNEKKGGKILDEESAKFFIGRANADMSSDVKIRFAENRLRAIMFYADPIISDDRFRMSLEDKRWHEYDETIKKEVAFYNQKFSGSKGFVPLDWRLVKAMVWTEVMAGPKNGPKQWQTFPMQIGRFAVDKGYVTVRDRKEDEGADIVVPPELSQAIQDKSKMVAHLNVRAGIAYLYVRATGQIVSEDETIDPTIQTYKIKSGDKISTLISKGTLKTTEANIIKNTPGMTQANIGDLDAGQEIRFQTAKSVRKIISWKDWMEAIRIYNVGDSNYMIKLHPAYNIIVSREAR